MRVRMRKRKMAILICFDTIKEKFNSPSERNRFFWGLYGRRQVIVRSERRYEYVREGLLEEIPHIKVDNSVFIIAKKYLRKVLQYFKKWEEKVEVRMFPVLLDEKEAKEIKIE
jgi:hypothetical protein